MVIPNQPLASLKSSSVKYTIELVKIRVLYGTTTLNRYGRSIFPLCRAHIKTEDGAVGEE